MFQIGEIVGKALPVTERLKFDLVELLHSGGRVIIVGGRTTNFSDEMRRDPRIEFWDSTDPKAHARDLPSNARALFFTRFINHEWAGRLRKQAKKRGIYCGVGVHDTGELRVELQRVVDHVQPKPVVVEDHPVFVAAAKLVAALEVPPPVVAAPAPVEPAPSEEPMPEPEVTEEVMPEPRFDWRPVVKQRKGKGVMDFVTAHANLQAESRTHEGERVLALMKAAGVTSTLKSVMEHIRIASRKAGIATKTAGPYKSGKVRGGHRKGNGSVSATMPLPAPPAPPKPPVEPVRQARKTKTLPLQADALIQAIGEAEHYIEDMQAAAKLLAELMPRLKTEISAFRDKQRRAAEIFLD